MATTSNELDSFIGKFRQLSRDGLNASLNLKSEAGQVSVSLSLVLGKEHREQTGKTFLGRNARERRRERRSA